MEKFYFYLKLISSLLILICYPHLTFAGWHTKDENYFMELAPYLIADYDDYKEWGDKLFLHLETKKHWDKALEIAL